MVADDRPVVSFWQVDGERARLDRIVDSGVRATLGAGRWTRRCVRCGTDRHGGRVFLPVSGEPVSVGIAHAGRRHVAVTAWTRAPVAVDLEHCRSAALVQSVGPLFAGEDAVEPVSRLRAWVTHEAGAKLRGGLGSAEHPGRHVHTAVADAGPDHLCVIAAPFAFRYSAR